MSSELHSQPILVIHPLAGLANRMRAMVSAQILAEKMGRKLYVEWSVTPCCHARMEDLLWGAPFEATPPEILLSGVGYSKELTQKQLPEVMALFQGVEVLHIKSRHAFAVDFDSEVQRNLEFHRRMIKWQISDSVRATLHSLPPGTIGVHIRLKDMWGSIRYCPLRLLDRAIGRELTHNPKAHFFLCSDTPWTIEHLLQKYGAAHFHTYPYFSARRDEADGVREAMRDLVTLSTCDHLWGSRYSSFVGLAYIWGNKPFRDHSLISSPQVWPYPVILRWSSSRQKWAPKKRFRPDAVLMAAWANFCLSRFYQLGWWHMTREDVNAFLGIFLPRYRSR